MPWIDLERIDELKRIWTDRFVLARTEHPELKRFADRVGRVVTVNCGGKAIVDFADGAWYDIPASEDYLTVIAGQDARTGYDPAFNSAQPRPGRQG